MVELDSFGKKTKAVVVGASGGIGSALVARLCCCPRIERVYALARTPPELSIIKHSKVRYLPIDLQCEESMATAAALISAEAEIDLMLVATGILHDHSMQPEKTVKALSEESFQTVMSINALAPMLLAKHFMPLFRKQHRTLFAALSARVGSISDNQLGGWYSYRASKAALTRIFHEGLNRNG
ncbi:MAG: SDR family NAD(P)-dependent oxidoreductase [Motiliproteus sp.]|nr:SDR family NAD(P)-dependent oxidoreductase [Motiliproteus sp.]MCW9052097.1 SDR family NAD(P)-dependent oxidoreductase [Motiliproteus sp.]